MEFKKANRHILHIWWIYLFLLTLMLSSLIFLIFKNFIIIRWFFAIVVFSVFIYLFVFYLPNKIKNFSYFVDENMLVIKSGVYRFKTTCTLVRNIQYVIKRRSIAERVFSLSSIIVKTAGGGNLNIYGLKKDEADKLTKEIIAYMKTMEG